MPARRRRRLSGDRSHAPSRPRRMSRPLFLLALGAAAGYAAGFRDAQHHDETVVRRVIEQIVAHAGGGARGKYDSDLDGRAGAADGADSTARR
ncbi:hypothetical protein tb265_30090 [Gemmatimonadetes bacterium T265]|nr:hypothetical protein tb265_30090 [Gemmatimonadetes bacterium T265]